MGPTVLVCTDGSALAVEAAKRGLELVRATELVIVATVTDKVDPTLAEDGTGHASSSMTHGEVAAQHDQAKAEAEEIAGETLAALHEAGLVGSNFEFRVVDGEPGPALCKLALDVAADVIVIGTRGRGGIKRAFLGSVSDYVVRKAPCPVVVTGSER